MTGTCVAGENCFRPQRKENCNCFFFVVPYLGHVEVEPGSTISPGVMGLRGRGESSGGEVLTNCLLVGF